MNDPHIAHTVHQGGYADVLLRPTMVGILRCGKMLPPQLNLVIEIEFAAALWSENAGAHLAGATLSTDFKIQNVRVLASQVVLDSALVESFNRVLLSGRSLVFSYPTVHTRPERRGGAQRHRGARLYETHVSDAAGQPAVPSQPHEGSLGALLLPLRPAGTYDNGAQHRHRPRGLPAPQLHAQDAAEWCQHLLGRPCPLAWTAR